MLWALPKRALCPAVGFEIGRSLLALLLDIPLNGAQAIVKFPEPNASAPLIDAIWIANRHRRHQAAIVPIELRAVNLRPPLEHGDTIVEIGEQRSRLGIVECHLGHLLARRAQGGLDLLEAARRRLQLFDVRDEDIRRLEATGEPSRTLDVHAHVSGVVMEKMAVEGLRVMPEDTLFTIADLSRLWVLADVYESDLASVRVGMRGEIQPTSLPGRAFPTRRSCARRWPA